VLGEQPAEVLMDMLERASGHEPATHDDMLALGTRLDGIDARLDQMDRRLDQVDTRFEMIDARFEKLDARFESRTADLTRSLVFTGIGVAMSSWVCCSPPWGSADPGRLLVADGLKHVES
jgi:hypothetical protein